MSTVSFKDDRIYLEEIESGNRSLDNSTSMDESRSEQCRHTERRKRSKKNRREKPRDNMEEDRKQYPESNDENVADHVQKGAHLEESHHTSLHLQGLDSIETSLIAHKNESSVAPIDRYMEIKNIASVRDQEQIQRMLGFTEMYGTSVTGGYFDREDICGACGIRHTRPDLLDMYNTCRSCYSVLREPSVLRKKCVDDLGQIIPQKYPLEILFATYGDPLDEDSAIVVTDKCIERCRWLSPKMDRFALRQSDALNEVMQKIFLLRLYQSDR